MLISRRVLTCSLLAFACLPVVASAVAADLPLVYSDDFESADTSRWAPADPEAWRLAEQDGNHVFNQFKQSDVKTPGPLALQPLHPQGRDRQRLPV